MDIWESTIEIDIGTREEVVRFLNRMGAQGWEAVSGQWVAPSAFYGTRTYYDVSLKIPQKG
jgi:hypothetical protein